MCYNIGMTEEYKKVKVRVIKYNSDSYIAQENYNEAVFEMLKESGVINLKRNKKLSLKRPERIIL